MNRRTLVGTALALSITVLQLSLGPSCWAQTAPKSKAKTPSGQQTSKAANDRSKREWEFGKISNMRDDLVIFGPASLLAAPAVQEELGLSEKQQEKLAVLKADDMRKRGERHSQFRRDVEALVRGELAARIEYWRGLDEILSKTQKRRLLELGIQTEGLLAAIWPEVRTELNVSPSQEEAFASIEAYLRGGLRVYHKSVNAVLHGTDPYHQKTRSRDEAQERVDQDSATLDRLYDEFEAKRERAEQEIARLLTRRQKAVFKKMKGQPYDVSDLQRPGGGNWQPEDAKRYWEEREAQKGKGTGSGKEKGAAGGPGSLPTSSTRR